MFLTFVIVNNNCNFDLTFAYNYYMTNRNLRGTRTTPTAPEGLVIGYLFDPRCFIGFYGSFSLPSLKFTHSLKSSEFPVRKPIRWLQRENRKTHRNITSIRRRWRAYIVSATIIIYSVFREPPTYGTMILHGPNEVN